MLKLKINGGAALPGLLMAAALLVLAPSAAAQEPIPAGDEVTQDEINAVARQLYCPVCENVPLDVCPTRACSDWREEIATMLAAGRDEDYIKAYFVEQYGQRVLATPEARGFDLLVWGLPVIGITAGAVLLGVTLRRMLPGGLNRQVQPVKPAAALDQAYLDRLERELAEFRGAQ